MRAQRQMIATSVAERLFAAEAAVDLAAARIAELNAALPLARLDARLAAAVGQDALATSVAAMMLIVQAREQVVATHSNLRQASDDIGLKQVSYGDLLKVHGCDTSGDARHLRVA